MIKKEKEVSSQEFKLKFIRLILDTNNLTDTKKLELIEKITTNKCIN